MTAGLLDAVLLLAVAVHLVRGWRAGGVNSVLAMVGAVAGGWAVLDGLPPLLSRWAPRIAADPTGMSVVVLTAVLFGAGAGEALAALLSRRISPRARGTWTSRLDALAGALAQSFVLCLVVATLASAVRPALPTTVTAALNSSRVLPVMDRTTPEAAEHWGRQLTRRLGNLGFPRAFSGLTPEPVIPVAPPDAKAAALPAVARAAGSIVKVRSDAPSCGEQHEGSGWVVAGHRVVTNAHVVAGASRTRVQVGGRGPRLEATVVAFDPVLDLAILDVPELDAPPLRIAPAPRPGQDVVVAGFPLDGAYTVKAARVRGTVIARGDDIYGGRGSNREVHAVNGTVLPGNSGGPLLGTDGRVVGTVFARSVVDKQTGYVLTNQATRALREKAASLTTPVSTQGCSRT